MRVLLAVPVLPPLVLLRLLCAVPGASLPLLRLEPLVVLLVLPRLRELLLLNALLLPHHPLLLLPHHPLLLLLLLRRRRGGGGDEASRGTAADAEARPLHCYDCIAHPDSEVDGRVSKHAVRAAAIFTAAKDDVLHLREEEEEEEERERQRKRERERGGG